MLLPRLDLQLQSSAHMQDSPPTPVPVGRHHPTGRSSDASRGAATLWECGSPPAPPAPHRAPTHKFSPKFSSFLLFSSFLHIEQRKQTTFPELFSCRLGGPPRLFGDVRLWPTIMPMRFSNGMENEHQRTILGAAAPLLCPMGVAAMIERTDVHACICDFEIMMSRCNIARGLRFGAVDSCQGAGAEISACEAITSSRV